MKFYTSSCFTNKKIINNFFRLFSTGLLNLFIVTKNIVNFRIDIKS